MLHKLLIWAFFKLERCIGGTRSIEKNLRAMGYSRADAKLIIKAYRGAIKM